jgi:hypothetical protein
MRALLIGLLSFGVIGGYGSAIAHVAHARGGCRDGRFGGGWDNRFGGDPRSGWAHYDDGRVQRFQLVDEARPAAPAAPSNAPVVINNSPAPAAAAPAPIIVVVPQGATYPVTVPTSATTQASAQQ